MLKRFILSYIATLFLVALSVNVYASGASSQVVVNLTEGDLKLEDLLAACSEIARSKPNKLVNKEIPGKILMINGKKYEVRYFAFEDTSGNLPQNMTFQEYAVNKNLLKMKSSQMEPLVGIHFDSFDYRRMKLEDGVYFSMALRLLAE